MFDIVSEYFAADGFSEASYAERWVTPERRSGRLQARSRCSERPERGAFKTIERHCIDLHHVATGYDTSLTSANLVSEISAFEIGGTLHRSWAASGARTQLAASALASVLRPAHLSARIVRGTCTARNLYRGAGATR